ncbi:MAG: hypothetical protein C0405_13335 [Desulfovibrio sp.]|nr:hypothetical protein [Desulfovibrio sp.]
MPLLNQAAYARHRAEHGLIGQTPAAVNKKIKKGQLSFGSGALVRQEDGGFLIAPQAADAEWAGNSDPAMRRGEPGPVKVREDRPDGQVRAPLTLNEIRAKHESTKALRAKLDFDERRGAVLERSLVEDAAFQAMRITRDQLRVLPSKLAPQMAYLNTPEACRKLLENEVRTICDDLSQRFRNLGNLGRGAGAGDQPPG